MVRFFVIALATAGAFLLVGHIFPSTRTIAFTLGTFGVTWLMILTMAAGGLSYKVTK